MYIAKNVFVLSEDRTTDSVFHVLEKINVAILSHSQE